MHADHETLPDNETVQAQTAVYVYEAPVRLWHWINALCIILLALTGYFIGRPLPSVGGEAAEVFVLGYIRYIHFAAAYVFAIGFVARIYWAFVGNSHARQLFTLPILDFRWWIDVLYELKWYFFLVAAPKKYVGHNPLALLMMFSFIGIGSIFMIFTGFALYSEGAQAGHWTDVVFGWVNVLTGSSFTTHMLHRTGMWAILIFIMIHVYAAIREDIVSRQSMISPIISGWRTFKD